MASIKMWKDFIMKKALLLKSIFICLISYSSAFAGNISIADSTAPTEKALLQTVVVFMSSRQSLPISLKFETFDGTATAGQDYEAVSGSLIFEVGETVKAIQIPILDDRKAEDKETIIVKISDASTGNITDDEAIVFITDDD